MKLAAAAAIAAGIGCIAGSAAVLALRALPPSLRKIRRETRTGVERRRLAVSAGPMGRRAGVRVPAGRLRRAGRRLRPAEDRLLQLLDRRVGRRRARTRVRYRAAEPRRRAGRQAAVRSRSPGWTGAAAPTGRSPGPNLLSVAFNDECDAVVAVARLDNGDPAVIEPAVLELLNTRPVVLWTKKELGLEFVKRDW